MKTLYTLLLFSLISCFSVNSIGGTLEGTISKVNHKKRTFTVAKKRFYLPEFVNVSLLGSENDHISFSQLANGMIVEVQFSKGKTKPKYVNSMMLLIH